MSCWDADSQINSFQPSIVFHIETSHLIWLVSIYYVPLGWNGLRRIKDIFSDKNGSSLKVSVSQPVRFSSCHFQKDVKQDKLI